MEVECLPWSRNWHFSFNYISCFNLKGWYKREIRYLKKKGGGGENWSLSGKVRLGLCLDIKEIK
jgi:hypothetical protein